MWKHLHFWYQWAACTSKCLIQSGSLGGQASCKKIHSTSWKGRKSHQHTRKILDWLCQFCLVVAVIIDFHHKDITQDITTEKQQQVHDRTGRAHNLDAAGASMWLRQVVTGRGAVITVSDLSHFSEFSSNTRMPHSDPCEKTSLASITLAVCIRFLFPPPQKKSCLTERFRPSNPQCTNDIKSS